jgi:threonine/homoserine/homoserine lactone efflux protein
VPFEFLGKGLLIGFSIAAPVGPIGVLCIRRSATGGPRMGLVTGLGAATADAFYGAVAAFGLTSVSGLLEGQRFWLQLAGGIFLLFLGIRAWRVKPSDGSAPAGNPGLPAAYASTFLLTLANPATILSFAAVFAGFGLANGSGYLQAAAIVAGVFFGSALWWLILSQGVGWFSARLKPDWTLGINRISGAVLTAFGVAALLGALSFVSNRF